jgi:hemoglobin-like flavoprotein
MSPEQIATVRRSFALVEPLAAPAAAMFYDRLFERDPGLRALFKGDMTAQGLRLMAMISAAVQLLDEPETLNRQLGELGRRHTGYGVQPQHYEAVGGALLDTLATALGPAFGANERSAWASLYGHISREMQAPGAPHGPRS